MNKPRRSEWVLLIFAVAAGLYLLNDRYFTKTSITRTIASVPSVASPMSNQEVVRFIAQSDDTDLFYQIGKNGQELLVDLTVQHCSRNYDKNICLKSVITCGRPCLASISKEERLRMLGDYRRIRRELGMGEL